MGDAYVQYVQYTIDAVFVHNVYFDNSTNEQLMTELEDYGVYACGTATKDRRGFPDQLKRHNLKKTGIQK